MKTNPQSKSDSARRRGAPLHPVDWAVECGAVDDVLQEMDARLRTRRWRRIRILSGSVVALTLAAFVWRSSFAPRHPETTLLSTPVVSLPSAQTLPDGSVVELREGAKITVAYTAERRGVLLLQGEAHFVVTKDPHRPFIVTVGPVEVCAVGTAFSVQRGRSEVEVLVTEGRVAVDRSQLPTTQASPSGPPPAPTPLAYVEKGKRAIVEAPASSEPVLAKVEPVSVDELKRRMAWRVPRLDFSGTPLRKIVPLVNQYSHVRLVLADDKLGDVCLSGSLRADNIETLLSLLDEGYGIKAVRHDGDEITLSKPGGGSR